MLKRALVLAGIGLVSVGGPLRPGVAAIADDLARAAELVVAIDATLGDRAVSGAGVIVARQRDALILVTANHVVRQGAMTAEPITVRLKRAPTVRFAGVLLPGFDRGDDLAGVRVEHLRAQNVDPCALPMPSFDPALTTRRGQGVFAIGNPAGVAWKIPASPEPAAEVDAARIMFESARLEAGHSGGGLYNAFGDLIGIIRADQPPNGVAVPLPRVLALLRAWGIPVEGGPAASRPAAGTNADACPRPEAPAATSTAGARPRGLPTTPDDWALHFERPLAADVFAAVRDGHVDDVRRLVDAKTLNTDGYHPPFPLHWAAAFGQVEVVKQLLLMGAKKNQWVYSPPPGVDLRAGTALHWAAAFNRVAVMQVLIRAGAELEEGEDLDQGPGTPLAVAVAFGNVEAARALLAAGARVDSRYGIWNSPVGEAVRSGRVDMLELLRASGARLSDPRSPEGASALLGLAVQSDHPDVMRYLIAKGVPLRDTAATASDRFDPMREAVLGGKLEALQVLLKAGASPNVGVSELPLELAITENNLAIIKALLKAGANPNLRTRAGESMLRLAQKAENDAAVELLLASGARR